MRLNVAVQMDPIERINIQGDSTFALLLEAQARGHRLNYYTPDRLAHAQGRVFAAVEPLSVRDEAGNHFTLGEPRRVELTEFDVVLLRQDPPFDLAYITTTHLLERIHPKTLVVNDPAHVRNAPEKVFVTEFPDLMPPTLITRDLAEIKAFRAEHGDIVMKPLYGHGGGAVFRVTRDDLNFGSLYDMFAVDLPRAMGGAEIPARREARRQAHHPGRRRIRRRGQPRAGGGRSALQHGARRLARGNRADQARAAKSASGSGRLLRERGLLFVGIDVIGDYLTEINVTSPTGIRAVKNFGGPDVAALVWDKIEAKRKARA